MYYILIKTFTETRSGERSKPHYSTSNAEYTTLKEAKAALYQMFMKNVNFYRTLMADNEMSFVVIHNDMEVTTINHSIVTDNIHEHSKTTSE